MTSTGLVLSGGGVRGAYQAGALAGIIEVVGDKLDGAAPFDTFAGTSIGALNTAYLAAHAHLTDLDVGGLVATWSELELENAVKMRPWAVLRDLLRLSAPTADSGRSLADPEVMRALVDRPQMWDHLYDNIDSGRVRGLFIAALEVATGRTALFADLPPEASYPPSMDPRRVYKRTRMNLEHLLASAAIPLLLPARRIDGGLYVDGGLRFNTPISPVLRAGAERLVVISMIDRMRPLPPPEVEPDEEQSLLFLAGKLVNAALLDPLEYDISILDRINALMGALEDVLAPEQLERVLQTLEEKRGAPYRRVDTLLFTPSEDIGKMAGAFIKQHADRWRSGSSFLHRLLRRSAVADAPEDADWASFVLFDGPFCAELIDLGRRDVLARADEVRAFFRV